MQVKYGILSYTGILFFPKDGFRFDFSENERLVVEPVGKTLSLSDSKHWAEWIGSLAWEEFSKGHVQIQIWRETKSPEVVDQENQTITDDLWRYAKALMICGLLIPPSSRPRYVTGRAEIKDGNLVPIDIRTTGKGPSWVTPRYTRLSEYTDSDPWKAVNYSDSHCYDKDFFQRWSNIYSQLTPIERHFGGHLLLNLSTYCFQQSLQEMHLDFSFPLLVRSIETLVALSPEQGRAFFARRAATYLPPKSELMFPLDEAKLTKILKESYGLRSDCVHGKPFGWGLGSKRTKFLEQECLIYSYVIENVARRLIQCSISDPDFIAMTKDRDTLEQHWNKVDPPPVETNCKKCRQPLPVT